MRGAFTAVLLTTLLASGAHAWPVDVYVDLEAGREEISKPASVTWVESEDPKVATAEVLLGGEVLVTGVSVGRTVVLLYDQGKLAAWRVRVWPKAEKVKPLTAEEKALRQACPGLTLSAEALAGPVKDERCRSALRAYLEADGYAARQLDLRFELSALQAQLVALRSALAGAVKPKVEARYLGAALVLEGRLTDQEHRRVLWETFRHTVGRVVLEDRVHVHAEAAAP
ncbi:MAG: pilus assembly protein N-terminal domain-containing protein [Myxococcota bacterium]